MFVKVRRLACEMVFQHLKDMAQVSGIVDVDVGDALIAFHKKRKLQVAEAIFSLKTVGGLEVFELRLKMVERTADRVKKA